MALAHECQIAQSLGCRIHKCIWTHLNAFPLWLNNMSGAVRVSAKKAMAIDIICWEWFVCLHIKHSIINCASISLISFCFFDISIVCVPAIWSTKDIRLAFFLEPLWVLVSIQSTNLPAVFLYLSLSANNFANTVS